MFTGCLEYCKGWGSTLTLPPSVFDPVHKLCSIDQADDPKTLQFKKRWCMFGLNLANHFIIIFNDTCPESSSFQWSNRILSLESRSSSNSFNLMAHGGAVSLDSSQNSPIPTLLLSADYMNHYHYSSGVTSSWNSPGSAPTNTVTQLSCDVCDSNCHILEIWLSPTLKISGHLRCQLQSCIVTSLYARKVIFL